LAFFSFLADLASASAAAAFAAASYSESYLAFNVSFSFLIALSFLIFSRLCCFLI